MWVFTVLSETNNWLAISWLDKSAQRNSKVCFSFLLKGSRFEFVLVVICDSVIGNAEMILVNRCLVDGWLIAVLRARWWLSISSRYVWRYLTWCVQEQWQIWCETIGIWCETRLFFTKTRRVLRWSNVQYVWNKTSTNHHKWKNKSWLKLVRCMNWL